MSRLERITLDADVDLERGELRITDSTADPAKDGEAARLLMPGSVLVDRGWRVVVLLVVGALAVAVAAVAIGAAGAVLSQLF